MVHTEWVLETDKTNLAQVTCLDDVNLTRTYSNNGVEGFNVLGIEAARTAIMRKLRHVIECGDSYVDYRHLAPLCTPVTHPGSLMTITRRGINRTGTTALMRPSFEKTAENLMEADAVGERDDCHSVTENVMFGHVAPMGTGSFNVALDMDIPKSTTVNPRLQMQSTLLTRVDTSMTPGHVAMKPYDSNSPTWNQESDKGRAASFPPLTSNDGEQSANLAYHGFEQRPRHASAMYPTAPDHRPEAPKVYSPTSSYVPQSPFAGATTPISTSPYVTSPFYDRDRAPTSPASPRYSP
ncbi:hypothetical protein EDB83DRAFT_2219488, partial [Lactarius deliciosus]